MNWSAGTDPVLHKNNLGQKLERDYSYLLTEQ